MDLQNRTHDNMTLQQPAGGEEPPGTAPVTGIVVAVGLPEVLLPVIANGREVIRTAPAALTQDWLSGRTIATIACPLIGVRVDAISVIEHLNAIGFRGHLTVVAPRVPNAAMVHKELCAAAEDFEIVLISP